MAGLAPKIHAKFANGLIYDFFNGRPLKSEGKKSYSYIDLSNPNISRSISISLAKWHSSDIDPVGGKSILIPTLYNWFRLCKSDSECSII